MNVVFRHKDHDEAIEKQLITEAKAANFDGIKGHRSVGGLRAGTLQRTNEENIEQFAEFIGVFS